MVRLRTAKFKQGAERKNYNESIVTAKLFKAPVFFTNSKLKSFVKPLVMSPSSLLTLNLVNYLLKPLVFSV